MYLLLPLLFFLTACAAAPTTSPALRAKAKLALVKKALDDDPSDGISLYRSLAPVTELEALHLTVPDHPFAHKLRDAVAVEKDPMKALAKLDELIEDAAEGASSEEATEEDDRELVSEEETIEYLCDALKVPRDTDIQRVAEAVIQHPGDDLIDLLIWLGADPKGDGEYPLLYHAVLADNVKAVEKLMTYDADPHWTDTEGRSLLWYALLRKSKEMIEYLLRLGAEGDFWSASDYNQCLFDAIKMRREDIVEHCLTKGADVHRIENGRSPLLQAIFAKYEPTIRVLLDYGADVTWRDANGTSLIVYAAASKLLPIVNIIAKTATELMPVDQQAADALMSFAAITHHVQVAQFAVSHGAAMEARSPPLSYLVNAVKRKDLPFAKILVDAGADVNFRDKQFYTPIYYAVMSNNLDMMRLLLIAGADPTMTTGTMEPLLRMAKQRGYHEAVRMLESLAVPRREYLPAAKSIVPHVQLHERSRAQFTSNEV